MITKDIYLTRKEAPATIEITAGSNAVDMIFRIMDWNVPAGATARIYVKKPSDHEVYNAAGIVGQNVVVHPTTQMTAEEGVAKCQIEITTGTKVVASFVFLMEVSEVIIDGSAVESTDEYTVLQELITQTQAAIDDCEAAADDARSVTGAYITTFTHTRSAAGLHTLTNTNFTNNPNIRFTATADWQEGDTMRIGTTAVLCKTMDGKELPPNSFKSGSTIFCLRQNNTLYFPVTAQREATTVVNISAASSLTLRRKEGTVFCDAYLPGAWDTNPRTFEGIVPLGFRPITEQRSGGSHAYNGDNISSSVMQLRISTLGIVKMKCTEPVNSTWTFYYSFCWDTADEFPES